LTRADTSSHGDHATETAEEGRIDIKSQSARERDEEDVAMEDANDDGGGSANDPDNADMKDGDGDDDESDSSESDSSDDSSSDEDDSEDNNGSANRSGAEEGDNADGLSSYERLRLERIKRNQERLAALGLLDVKEQVRQQQQQAAARNRRRKKKKKAREDGEAAAPQRILPKRQARSSLTADQLNPFDVRRMRISSDPRYYERRNGAAAAAADRYRRTYRCGECAGCDLAEDCGQCVWCVNMMTNPKRLRRCLMKLCRKRLVDTAVTEGAEEGEDGGDAAVAEEGGGNKEAKTITVTMADLIKKNRIKMPPAKMPSSSGDAGVITDTSTAATLAPDGTATDGEEKKEDEEGDGDHDKNASDGAATSDGAKEGDAGTKDAPPITFPESCFACKEDGILFCCDTCPRGFHSHCHFPKIRDFPVGDWQCMECIRAADGGGKGGTDAAAGAEKAPEVHAVLPAGFDLEEHVSRSGKKRGARSPKRGRKRAPEDATAGGIYGNADADANVSSEPGKIVKVTIHEPRARCMTCSEYGDVDEEAAILCRACDQYFHKDCQTLDHKRGGRWRCDACQTSKASVWYDLLAVIPEEGVKNGGEEDGNAAAAASGKTIRVSVVGPETKCVKCSQDGRGREDMVWCRACDMSFHLGCHLPPLQTIPKGRWKCGKCKAANIPLPKPPRPKIKPKNEVLANLNLFKGEHDDDCYICYNGGGKYRCL